MYSEYESLTSEEVYVLMTFEEEKPCFEDFESREDNLTLSSLRNQNFIDQIDVKVKPDPEHGNSNINLNPEKKNTAVSIVDGNHPSLFKKKELIEGEIISESQVISSRNVLSVPDDKSADNISLLPVKIETEPIDTECKYSESHTSEAISSQSLAYNIVGLTTKSPKINEEKNAISKPEVSEPNNKPIIFYQSLQKFECVNKVVSAIPSSITESSNTEIITTVVPSFSNMSSDSHSLNIKDFTHSVCDKNKKSTKINSSANDKFDIDISPSTEFMPHSELPKEIDEHFTGNVVDSKSTSITNVDNISPSKKRGKKIVDENMSVTLVIKKGNKPGDANVDADASESSVCTKFNSKSSIVESQSAYCSNQEIFSVLLLKNSAQQLEGGGYSATSTPKTSPTHLKNNKKDIKKQIQYSSTVNIDDELFQSEINTSVLPVSKQKDISSASDESSQSYSEVADLLSVKKYVKKKKIGSFALEELPNFSSCSSNDDESMSTINSLTSTVEDMSSKSELSNFDSEPDLNSNDLPKKKKNRARSSCWYKKKKPRTKQKIPPPVESLPIQIPSLEINNSLFVTAKQPVVIIQKFLPEMRKNENNLENVVKSQTNEQVPINLFKGQGGEGRKSLKRKISSSQFNDNGFPNEEYSLQNSLSTNNGNSYNLENKSSKISKTDHSENCAAKETNEFGIQWDRGKKPTLEHRSVSDEPNLMECSSTKDDSFHTDLTVSKEGQMLSSLNVQQNAKEVAVFEEIVENRMNNDTSLGSTGQITIKSDLENDGLSKQNIDQNETSLIDENKNSSDSSIQNHNKTSVNDGLVNCLKQNNNFQLQKEFDVNLPKNSVNKLNQPNQNSQSPLNHFRRVLSDKESNIDKTKADSNSLVVDLTSIRKERCVETHSSYEMSVTESRRDSVPNVRDNTVRVKSVDNAIALSKLQGNLAENMPKNVQSMDVNCLSLLNKREICDTTKLISSNNITRDQNDLIHKVNDSDPETSIVSTNNPCAINSNITSILPQEVYLNSASLQRRNYVENFNDSSDEEIQIISEKNPPKNVPSAKNVPSTKSVPSAKNVSCAKKVTCIDLTDDACYSSDLIQETQLKSTEWGIIKSMATEFIERIKTENVNLSCTEIPFTTHAEIKQVSIPEKQNCLFSFNKSNDYNSEFDSSKIKTNSSASNFFQETDMNEDSIERTSNSVIERDKYIGEYFKHPFPPSLVFYSKMQRVGNKMYSRIYSKTWNLTIDEVCSRLKHSENTPPQHGKKNEDVIKLEKYPVSLSETECYHRILGVAPSHQLSSPRKILRTNINSKFNTSKQRGDQKKIENKNPCTINYLLQGVAETKMMSTNIDANNDSSLFDKDCPAYSENSFESCISSVTDNFLTSNKGIKDSNIFPIKKNELVSSSKDESSGRNSAPSCSMSDFQDSYKSGMSSMDVSSIKNCYSQFIPCLSSIKIQNVSHFQSEILTNSTLTSQERINNTINNNEESQSTYGKISYIASNSFTQSKNEIVNNALPSLSDNYALRESYLTPKVKANESQPSLNVIDLPATELRKILETAGSLHSDNVNYENEIWKNKTTFEYNHTQSYPVLDVDLKQNNEVKSSDSGLAEMNKNNKMQTENETSDDEYVDNEPIYFKSDNDSDDNCSRENETEEPIPIQQQKSKGENIIERKSQLEDKVNESFLKDCFHVSSPIKPQKRKSNILYEEILQSISKESKEEECDMLQKSKSKKDSCTEESKSDTYVEEQNKSLKISKNTEEEKSTTMESKDTEKELVSVNKTSDDASDSFGLDKLENSSSIEKSVITSKSDDNNKSNCFYGNRVTNRGFFLTETSSSELLKKIKTPKEKIPEVIKASVDVPTEEFHSMIKSPDINIDSSSVSSSKFRNKTIDKSPLSDAFPSTASHFVSTKGMWDRQHANSQFNFSAKNNPPNRKPSRWGKAPFVSSCHGVDNMPNRKYSLFATPYISSLNDETMLNRTIPVLNTPAPSISSHHFNEKSIFDRNFPLLNTPSSASQLPSKSLQINLDSSVPLLQNNYNPFSEGEYSTLPLSECMNTTWCSNQYNSLYEYNDPRVKRNVNFQSNLSVDCQMATNPAVGNISVADSLDLQRAALGMQRNMPVDSVIPVNASFRKNYLSGSLDSQRVALGMHSVSNIKNNLDPTQGSGSQILNSQPYSTPINLASQIFGKVSCLVPEHLKSLIGHETIETHNVLLLMLEWSADWLNHQQKMHDPPQISEALKMVLSSYDSFEDYYNTFFPLMLLETWERIYVSWTQRNKTAPYLCQISSYSVKNHYVSVECQTVYNTRARPKGIFPHRENILVVTYSTKSNKNIIKILGYVTQVKVRSFNPVTDSKIFSSPNAQKDATFDPFDDLNVLTLTFKSAYNSEDIDKFQPVRIHVLCSVKHTLKQNDAMLYINKSPLKKSILNPVADGLLTFTLTPRNSSEEKVNECVRDITERISLPHPQPLFAVVRTTPESDRLNIIPRLIQKMKSTYKTKVLLCVRTVGAFGDIASNILQQSLKLVIVNRRCDINPQFQKYMLDELVSTKKRKMDEKAREKIHSKNENFIRKQILKDCDVVLSFIRNSHDEFIYETFLKAEIIAQMCCIVDEAHSCTEPETLIPILHGISKLILIGDADYSAKVLSKTASSYGYNLSFFQRAYDFIDLLTE